MLVRWLLWALVYTFSSGRVVLWLLPNLDDDKLGVIDSFKPLFSLKFKKKKKKTQEKLEEKAKERSEEVDKSEDEVQE